MKMISGMIMEIILSFVHIRFRHTFGVKLTEMKLDDDSIARLVGA